MKTIKRVGLPEKMKYRMTGADTNR